MVTCSPRAGPFPDLLVLKVIYLAHVGLIFDGGFLRTVHDVAGMLLRLREGHG